MTFELPLVSVIIPTYNRVAFVLDAIESAKKQTYPHVEIIVVDDGSVDDTKTLLSTLSGITYIYKDNGGQASARNAGFSVAKGELIASLDSDDIWDNNFLEVLVHKMLNDQLDFVFAQLKRESSIAGESFRTVGYNIHLLKYIGREHDGWVSLSDEETRTLYINTCPSPSTSFLITRKALGNGWNEDMLVGDDWFMQLSVVLSGYSKCAFYVNPLWLKRVNDINVYDERDAEELCLNLHIHDIHLFIESFRSRLTKEECKILRRFYVDGYIGLAIMKAKGKADFGESFQYLWESLKQEFLITSKVMLEIFYKVGLKKIGFSKTMKSY